MASQVYRTEVAPEMHALSGGLPLSAVKEQFSLGYVHMVAAAAGFWVKRHETDYDGVDITIVSSKEYVTYFGPQFELQVKCTARQDLLKDGHLTWRMEAGPYAKLVHRKRYLPAYLGVLVVPGNTDDWLRQSEASLATTAQMYWVRARDLPAPAAGRRTVTARLPRSNLFDVPQLRGIMKTIGEEGGA